MNGHRGGRRHRRACVWRAVPNRRIMEAVGALLIGGTIDVPAEIAEIALAIAQRTRALIAEGQPPAAAYEAALAELGLAERRSS